MPTEDDPRNHSRVESSHQPGGVSTDEVPAPRAPIEDAADFPSDDRSPSTSSHWGTHYSDEPPGPVATDTDDPDVTDTATDTADEPAANEFPADESVEGTERHGGGMYESVAAHRTPSDLDADADAPAESAAADEVGTEDPAVGVAAIPESDESSDEPDETFPATASAVGGAPDDTDLDVTPTSTEPVEAEHAEPTRVDAEPAGTAIAGLSQPHVEPSAEAEAEAEDADAVAASAGPEELAPGDVPAAATMVFWESETTDGFRDRWQQIQLRFIDDPRQATEQAQALVTDVISSFTEGLHRQRGEVDRWQGAQLDDTEELRVTVRRYRDLLDRLLDL